VFDHRRVEGVESERGRGDRDHRRAEFVLDPTRERLVVVEFGGNGCETSFLGVAGRARRDVKPMLERIRPHFVHERGIRKLACRRVEHQPEVADPEVTAYVDPAAAVTPVCLLGRDRSVAGCLRSVRAQRP
jgi:hypothetical protein